VTTSEIILLAVTILTAGGSFLGVRWAANRGRETGKEDNDTKRFQAFMDAYEKRIEGLEGRVSELETKNTGLEEENARQAEMLKQIRKTVGSWFARLEKRWYELTDEPMPLPTMEELQLLEITVQR
jgi:predicted nuclease with TOPRIM domain